MMNVRPVPVVMNYRFMYMENIMFSGIFFVIGLMRMVLVMLMRMGMGKSFMLV
jgi:hypothetical protein